MEQSPSQILNCIRQKSKISLEEYPALKSSLYDNLFSKIPVITNKILKGQFLFRTVPVYRNDITMGRKKYISYRPLDCNYPYFNRCTEPEKSHFYCSTTRHLSLLECSYFISEIESEIGKFNKISELLEVGVWEVKEDLNVADLRYGTYAHANGIKEQSELKEKYKEFVKEKYVSEFFEYINQLFEVRIKKSDHINYWLTACYSNYIFDDTFKLQSNWGIIKDLESEVVMSADGILYHSVKGIQTDPPIEGYNLALRTNVIDSGKVQLVKAGVFKTQQTDSTSFIFDEMVKLNVDIKGDSWYYMDPNEKR